MTKDTYRSVTTLLEERPDFEAAIEEILRVDREKGRWDFDDISLESGPFGEIVSRGIVEKDGSSYTVADRRAVERALAGEDYSDSDTREPTAIDRIFDLESISVTLPHLLLGGFALIGVAFRLYDLGQVPFWIDEAHTVSTAMGLLEYGELVNHGSQWPYRRGATVTYAVAASIRILGFSEFAARLPVALAGIATIPLVYLLGREVHSVSVGLIAMGLFAVSWVDVGWARQARMYAVLQLFFVAAVFVYILAREEYVSDGSIRPRYLGLFAALIVLARETHQMWMLIPAVVLVDAVLTLKPDRRFFRRLRIVLLSSMAGYLLLTVVTNDILLPDPVIAPVLGSGFYLEYLDLVPEFVASHYPVVWLLATVGTIAMLARQNVRQLVVTLPFWMGLFVVTYFVMGIQGFFWPRYLLFATPFLFLSAAVGIAEVWRLFPETYRDYELHRTEFQAIGVFLVVLVAIVALPGFSTNVNELSNIHEPQPDSRGAAKFVKNQSDADDVVIANWPNYLYVYGVDIDYSASTFGTVTRNGTAIDAKTGVPPIESKSELKHIIETHDCGWIVYTPYMGLEGTNWVKENLTLVRVFEPPFPEKRVGYTLPAEPNEGEQRIHVYHWENETSDC
ncbi:glycosyltransferase family 39 protein [Halosimplex halobium]|uniref:glycosyltransferase family 39 protein n=1 Tax=Halosimplex halobium TaxID=3396618 RepID=UPI003F5727BC